MPAELTTALDSGAGALTNSMRSEARQRVEAAQQLRQLTNDSARNSMDDSMDGAITMPIAEGIANAPAATSERSRTAAEGVRLLKQGTEAIKFSRSGKPAVTLVKLSEDERTITWLPHGLGRTFKTKKAADGRSVALSSVWGISIGRESAAFQRSAERSRGSAHLSFSLVLKAAAAQEEGRETLDLCCVDEESFGLVVAAFRALLEERAKAKAAANRPWGGGTVFIPAAAADTAAATTATTFEATAAPATADAAVAAVAAVAADAADAEAAADAVAALTTIATAATAAGATAEAAAAAAAAAEKAAAAAEKAAAEEASVWEEEVAE